MQCHRHVGCCQTSCSQTFSMRSRFVLYGVDQSFEKSSAQHVTHWPGPKRFALCPLCSHQNCFSLQTSVPARYDHLRLHKRRQLKACKHKGAKKEQRNQNWRLAQSLCSPRLMYLLIGILTNPWAESRWTARACPELRLSHTRSLLKYLKKNDRKSYQKR